MSVINQNLLLTPEGYQISRSVRLRSSASAYFNRTPAVAANRKTWTWSAWIKRGALGVRQGFFSCQNGAGNASLQFGFLDNDCFQMGNGNVYLLQSAALCRDPSAWYHCVVSVDTTLASNRSRVYINGNQITTWATNVFDSNVAQNTDMAINNNLVHYLGQIGANLSYLDGYLTEVNFIDGQALTPSSFGETDAVTGVWKPKKYAGTYGTNGFYLNFSDNSAATAAAIGKDNSGNGNNWTPNNISVTAGVTYDSMLDVPTLWADGGNGRGNYAVLNPLAPTSVYNSIMSNGNLTATLTATTKVNTFASMPMPQTGQWYCEVQTVSNNLGVAVGIAQAPFTTAGTTGTPAVGYYNATGNKFVNGTATAYGTAWIGASRTDTIGMAVDTGAGTITFYLNNVSQGAITIATGVDWFFAGTHTSGSGFHTENWNFGQRPFAYTPPTGFLALNTQNLPAVTINNGAQYMAATTYTGNGSTQSISNGANNPIGTTFQPDFVWVKYRNQAYNNDLFDSVRGVSKYLRSNTTQAELSYPSYGVTAFNSNGFSVTDDSGGSYEVNGSSGSLVAWQWKAGGTAVSNTSGSITSSVSANTTAGFSVVTYTGTGANATVGHGLGVAPKMMITKKRSTTGNWSVYHANLTSYTYSVYLNATNAQASDPNTRGSAPSSSTFSVGTDSDVNANGATYVAYLFAEVAGYSKFGSYTGNGSADGPFVYLGFRPKFVMIKETGASGNWNFIDTSRSTYNAADAVLLANTSGAEIVTAGGAEPIDILSNGFKLKYGGAGDTNTSGGSYIYAAFAENPFKNSLAR